MNNALTRDELIIHNWSKTQSLSFEHWMAVLGFAAITYFAFYSMVAMIIGYVVLFLVTALPRVYKMIIFFIIITVITTIFPPLGIILTVIFFIARIGYIFENWKALLSGVLLYAYPFMLGFYIKNSYYAFSSGEVLATSLTAGLVFHFVLVWLYHNKFSTKNALGAMGAAPLFFIMLLVPFIIQEVSDVIDFNDFSAFEQSLEDVEYNEPGIHSVKGHWRLTQSGEYTYVDPHIRTNPDGIESNNISYKK